MDWGMENRLARIVKPIDGKAVMLAVDHGYFLGPTEKLENPRKTVEPLVKYCDSLMLTRGIQRSCVDPKHLVPIVLRVSGGSSIIGDDLSHEDIVTSVKEAVRLNASALAMSIFVGSKYEHKSIVNLGKLVNEAEEYGIPVLAVTAVGKEMARDARYLSLACRIAAEQGARIVKTYHCKDFMALYVMVRASFSGIFLPPAIMTGTGHEFTTFSKSLQWYVFTMRAPCSAAILHASER